MKTPSTNDADIIANGSFLARFTRRASSDNNRPAYDWFVDEDGTHDGYYINDTIELVPRKRAS